MNTEQGTQQSPIVVDTNCIIEFGKWNPVLLNEVFWRKLAESLTQGKWMLLDVVAKEVKYNDPLIEWIKTQDKNSLVALLDDGYKDRGVEINNTWPMITKKNRKSETDTYIIAYAEANGNPIFTQEGRKGPEQKTYKIPDVCDVLKIPVIDVPEDFLNALGYKN